MSVSTAFPDSTYSSSNKPSTTTLKSDVQALETAINALPSLSETLTNKTLTNPVVNYTDTTIGVNVKSRAYLSADQSINTGTSTRVQFNTETYDVGSDYDNATNYQFTAPVTGYYAVSVCVTIESPVDGTSTQLDLLKNAADYIRVMGAISGTNDTACVLSDTVLLSSGNTLEVKFAHSSGVAKNISGGTGPERTYFSVHLLSV